MSCRRFYAANGVGEFGIEGVRERMTATPNEYAKEAFALGLSSKVIAGGTAFHLLQIDFCSDVSKDSLQGRALMPENFWRQFIDGLDDNVVDGQWAWESTHGRQFSILRLTPAYGKPVRPKIVSRIYSDRMPLRILPLLFEN